MTTGRIALNHLAKESLERCIKRIFFFACCELGKRGCTHFDLMGIGSDFSPALNGLNTFKTKFAKEVTHVAPDRDVPVKGAFYKSLQVGKRVLTAVRERGKED